MLNHPQIITVGVASADSTELRAVASDPADRNAVFSKSYSSVAALDIIEPIRNAVGACK